MRGDHAWPDNDGWDDAYQPHLPLYRDAVDDVPDDWLLLARCHHPNVFGCPNHGSAARRLAKDVLKRLELFGPWSVPTFMRPSAWPAPYRLTEKGRRVVMLEVHALHRHDTRQGD